MKVFLRNTRISLLIIFRRTGILRCICVFCLCSSTMPFLSAQVSDPVRFLALGDSYTIGQNVPQAQRWPVQLADSLEARGYTIDTVRIIATTGWRTDQLINAIAGKGLENDGYNLVSLLIGVNNQYQSRPFSQYENEFPALLDSAIRYAGGNPDHVFVVSIPDYAYTPFGQSADPEEISAELAEYNAYNMQVAADLGVQYFNITPISQLGVQIPQYVANDGLHPSGLQYTEWVKLMLETFDQISATEPSRESDQVQITISYDSSLQQVSIDIGREKAHSQSSVRCITTDGRLILSMIFTGQTATFPTSGIPPGIYFIEVHNSNTRAAERIIIR